MSNAWLRSSVACAALALAAGAAAQDVPRMADGKPDFSGMYTPPATVNATGPRGNLIFNADKMAPVKPGAESLLYQPRTGDARIDEPRAMCLPSGFPSGMLYILPIQIVQNSKYIVIIPELQRAARIIPLDGRPHRADLEPSYYGDSVGRWEGDTLVVDVIGFNDKGWLTGTGTHHSDALRVTERYTRVDKDQIDYVVTMDDPNVFTEPWTIKTTLMHREGTRLQEYVCAENNVEMERFAKILREGVQFTR